MHRIRNYTFGGRYSFDFDRSTWQLRAFHGTKVDAWVDRGTDRLVVRSTGAAAPLADPNGLGPGRPGMHFDGIASHLDLDGARPLGAAHSVFWVARTPWNRQQFGDTALVPIEATSPGETLVGGSSSPTTAIGLSAGQIHYLAENDGAWASVLRGRDLMADVGRIQLLGVTHAESGETQAFIDGAPEGNPGLAAASPDAEWETLGAGFDHRPASHYGGMVGAVVIVPAVLDKSTIEKLYTWARGRFGASSQ